MAGIELCDARTLEALDFASVQNRVVSATRTQRGKTFALEMTPHTDFDRVRVEQARTAATRELVAGSDLHVMNAIDTADLTQAAALTRTLGTSELRAIGDAIAAAAAAYNATHESDELRPLLAGLFTVTRAASRPDRCDRRTRRRVGSRVPGARAHPSQS